MRGYLRLSVREIPVTELIKNTMKQNRTIKFILSRLEKIDLSLLAIISLALFFRLAWIFYTNYTEEDAFITFRFARQLAKGQGFVFNIGEPIYGTTTPLFTLLMSFWYMLAPRNIVFGARVLDLLSAIGTMFFLWEGLRSIGQSRTNRLFTLAILVLSSKLLLMDTQGMETPFLLFFMAASWHTWIKRQVIWTGLLLGLLLWTRIDLFPWVVVLACASLISNPKDALKLIIITSIVYLPWLVFSMVYFGSPIPHTILAKWVAYSKFNETPLLPHFTLLAQYLSIFEIPRDNEQPQWLIFMSSFFTLLTLGLALWQTLRIWRDRRLAILPVFAILEMIRLTLTRETFFDRYFIPALWVIFILVGLALGTIWDLLEKSRFKKFFIILIAIGVFLMFFFGFQRAQVIRVKQLFRHEASLKAIGIWLHENTPPESIVQLEPLGYIGYYSDREIIDEVGLVTPRVTELKKERINADLYFVIFQPNYLVMHCDDVLRFQEHPASKITKLTDQYQWVKTFNPLEFDPLASKTTLVYGNNPRSSCYEIWQQIDE